MWWVWCLQLRNLAGAAALKPGDVVRHYGGITSEVVNTDAEGRLILGDAIAYGIDKYKPDAVIDIAILTGAAVIGLGHHYSGLLSNNEHLAEMLIQAGKKASEPLWRLPLGPEYRKQLDSSLADMKTRQIEVVEQLQQPVISRNLWERHRGLTLILLELRGILPKNPMCPKGLPGWACAPWLTFLQNWK